MYKKKILSLKIQYFMSQYSSNIKLASSFRIIIVGDANVGKTSLLLRYVDNQYHNQVNSTVGLDYRSKNIIHNDEYFKLQLWDTAGQERYRSIVVNYFKLSKSAIIMFDVSKLDSIDNSRFWLNQIATHCQGVVKVLVGNKSDLLQSYGSDAEIDQYLLSVSPKIKELQNEFKCKYFMISCKSGQGVDLMFQYLVQELYKQYKRSTQVDRNSEVRKSISIIKEPLPIEIKNTEKKKGCC